MKIINFLSLCVQERSAAAAYVYSKLEMNLADVKFIHTNFYPEDDIFEITGKLSKKLQSASNDIVIMNNSIIQFPFETYDYDIKQPIVNFFRTFKNINYYIKSDTIEESLDFIDELKYFDIKFDSIEYDIHDFDLIVNEFSKK
jgi:hypothetical protein